MTRRDSDTVLEEQLGVQCHSAHPYVSIFPKSVSVSLLKKNFTSKVFSNLPTTRRLICIFRRCQESVTIVNSFTYVRIQLSSWFQYQNRRLSPTFSSYNFLDFSYFFSSVAFRNLQEGRSDVKFGRSSLLEG